MLEKSEVMNFNVYTIRDRVAEEYGPPFTAKNDGVAQRHFLSVISGAKNCNPSDFELAHVGYWNPLTGEILPSPQKIVSGG